MAKKVKEFDELEKDILKEYGDSIARGSDIGSPSIIPTGILSVDSVLGGGVPRGRITEIYGPPSTSKTLLLYCMIAQAQKQGGTAVLIDAENTFEAPWAEKNGVDVKNLRVVKPSTGEEAYTILLQYIAAGVDIVGLDSIANVVPRAELEDKMSQANIGLAARLNAKAMRKISTDNKNTAVVLINQIRANVSTSPFVGNPETTSGGKAIPFYASLRLNMRRIGHAKVGEDKTGGIYRLRVEKAKTGGAQVHKVAQFEVDYNDGVDIAKDIMVHAMSKDLITKKGSWYYIGEESRQGERAIKAFMLEEGLVEKWRKEILDEIQDS